MLFLTPNTLNSLKLTHKAINQIREHCSRIFCLSISNFDLWGSQFIRVRVVADADPYNDCGNFIANQWTFSHLNGYNLINKIYQTPQGSAVSLRLGHTRVLTTHCVVSHCARATSLPRRPDLNINYLFNSPLNPNLYVKISKSKPPLDILFILEFF